MPKRISSLFHLLLAMADGCRGSVNPREFNGYNNGSATRAFNRCANTSAFAIMDASSVAPNGFSGAPPIDPLGAPPGLGSDCLGVLEESGEGAPSGVPVDLGGLEGVPITIAESLSHFWGAPGGPWFLSAVDKPPLRVPKRPPDGDSKKKTKQRR